MGKLSGLGKLVKFAEKQFHNTTRTNCGTKIREYSGIAGEKIEVFQRTKRSGFLGMGKKRTITSHFAEGADTPLLQTAQHKKGSSIFTHSTYADGKTISSEVNRKTGNIYSEIRDHEGNLIKNIEGNTNWGREVTVSDRYGETYIRKTKTNDGTRSIIKENEIMATETKIEADGKVIRQNACRKDADGNWEFDNIYWETGKVAKPLQSTANSKTTGRKVLERAGVGLAIGLPILGSAILYDTVNSNNSEEQDIDDSLPEEEVSSKTSEEEITDNDNTTEESEVTENPEDSDTEETSTETDDTETTETTEQNPPTSEVEQQTPPSDNLFGGEINEITEKEYDVVSGDCLWNIAKAKLRAANPGVTITNGQILKQVKEFERLNPEIENPDLIFPRQHIKLCA